MGGPHRKVGRGGKLAPRFHLPERLFLLSSELFGPSAATHIHAYVRVCIGVGNKGHVSSFNVAAVASLGEIIIISVYVAFSLTEPVNLRRETSCVEIRESRGVSRYLLLVSPPPIADLLIAA